MSVYTIKDLENLSGIKAHTIRIWEQRYSFLKPQRTGTNIRYYTNDELKAILNIALLNKYGFKISHIDKMSPPEIREKILSLAPIEAQAERVINDLIQDMIELDQEKFENLLDDYIQVNGIEKAITVLIFPFMEKIGLLWQTDHINPAQEHIVSNIVRQKIILGIEQITNSQKINKTVCFFLPDGEYHEIGLLFMNFMMKSRGINVIYLGANVPLEDLEYVVKIKKVDFVFAHLTSISHNFNLERLVNNLTRRFPSIPIIITGRPAMAYKKKLPPKILFKKSYQEVLDLVEL
ncbi:MAG: MerR family transcriptional regulator [Chitinophagaceae bacterium]